VAKRGSKGKEKMKIGLVSAAATAALVVSTTAFGQAPTPAPPSRAGAPAAGSSVEPPGYVEQRLEGNQVVVFGGDPLKGDENSPYGIRIGRPPGVLRAGLIRPRMNFVSELLKSVENL
jgi:hypothetical protein